LRALSSPNFDGGPLSIQGVREGELEAMCYTMLLNCRFVQRRARRSLRYGAIALGCVLALTTCAQLSRADVTVINNVVLDNGDGIFYSDNPFTTANEGIPRLGNNIDPFLLSQGFDQSNFEGRRVDNGAGLADDENINFNITVGQTSDGTLIIAGNLNGSLRDMNLIIGDAALDLNNQFSRGTGTVQINGGGVYNNDPWVLPFIPPPGVTPTNISVNPRTAEPGFLDGFDLVVGRLGTGTLEISLGGRAEIHDAVVVADQPDSNGRIVVDGVGSFLGSGGFEESDDPEILNHFIVGRLGLGEMSIQNGGLVVTEAPTGGDDPRHIVGAVIGGDAFDNLEPLAGGQGIVTVTGPGSRWIVGGAFQVGGFDDANDGALGLGKDFEGDDVLYDSIVGHGTLIVELGGLVSVILPATDDEEPPVNAELLFVNGFFGEVRLDGGRISLGSGGTLLARSERMQFINDGIIKGSGRIDTGTFRNRYLGRVRVDAAQTLIIASTSEFTDEDLTDLELDDEPLVNFGLIEVIGTADARAEIDFRRAPTFEDNPIRPFINRPVVTAFPQDFDGGLISAQHATLRFQSGILNEGTMAFTAGTNIISGRVDNIIGPGGNGLFLVSSNTDVIIEDDFSSGGSSIPMPIASPIVTILEGSTLTVLDRDSFTLTGILDMTVSLNNPSKIVVGGDVGLRGDLFVSFASDAITSISHGDAFELIYFAGDIGGVDDVTDPVKLSPDLAVNPVLNVVPSANFQFLYPNLDLIVVRILQSLYLFALDPTMVGTPGGPGAMGPDFNGDGFVDNTDFLIWQANVGITMGASVLQGDADMDGDVDGDDFLIWQANIGPFPGAGAGSGNGDPQFATVPEPAGIALAFCGGLLAMALRGRRRRCYRR
jgi:hypothetical protein